VTLVLRCLPVEIGEIILSTAIAYQRKVDVFSGVCLFVGLSTQLLCYRPMPVENHCRLSSCGYMSHSCFSLMHILVLGESFFGRPVMQLAF